MKTKHIIITLSLVLTTLLAFPQGKMHKDYIWKYQGKKKENTLGMYGGLYGSYADLMSKPSANIGGRMGLVFNKRFGLGIAFYGISYDRTLNEAVDDGTYHLEAGYSGVFFEYIQPLGENFKVSAFVITGGGIAKYTYDKDYRDGKEWYEETIDIASFSVFEPGIELQTRLAGKWWLGAYATYRFSSPIDLKESPDYMLTNFTAGLSLKFGVF